MNLVSVAWQTTEMLRCSQGSGQKNICHLFVMWGSSTESLVSLLYFCCLLQCVTSCTMASQMPNLANAPIIVKMSILHTFVCLTDC